MNKNKKPEIIELPQFLDPRGNLAVIEEYHQIPFKIERVHWIYDVPGGGEREGHAYHNNEELIVALSGSFDVIVSKGDKSEVFSLNRAYKGLYLPPMTWRELANFSTNSVVCILSSTSYDPTDYITDFECFNKLTGCDENCI